MSEGEYESFEINDYDLENEFNPNRPRAKQSKHQQIYGLLSRCTTPILKFAKALFLLTRNLG